MQREIDVFLIEDTREKAFIIKNILTEIGGYTTLSLTESADEGLKYLKKVLSREYRLPEFIFLGLCDNPEGSRTILKFVKDNPELRSIPVAVILKKEFESEIDSFYGLYANCCMVMTDDLVKFKADMEALWRFWLETARLYARELI